MKNILFKIAAAVFFVLIQFHCSHKMVATVAKNVDLSEDFKSIKSYDWTSDIDNIPSDQIFIGPNGVLFFNNESARKMIKDAIKYELDSRGYKKLDGDSSDMLVSFFVLEQPASLRTTNGYVTLPSGKKLRTKANVSYTDVKAGTLIINFISNKNDQQIWQGFASGILKADEVSDQSKIREAVSKIFSEFKYTNNV